MANAVGNTRDDEVTFISGVNTNGTLAAVSLETYNGDTPDTYSNQSRQFHWGPNNSAGTAGGTLTYRFDTASNWNTNEQAYLASSLDMWSAVANISFRQTNSAGDANIAFERNDLGRAFAETESALHPVGSSVITPPLGSATVSLDMADGQGTATGNHGILGNFQNGGFGVYTTIHEAGHALGLGHGGPYNGTNATSQQYGPFDNQSFSVMSYFDTADTLAYPNPAGTPNWTTNGITSSPTTWMPVDIDAIQRLYGVPTSGQFTSAQTFGYNTTISGSLKPYFDFSVNTRPVLTLYGTAQSGNTLDLSGSGQDATLNLNGGTYSSAFGMKNNIAIYDKTYIQNTFCGAGNDFCTVSTSKDNTIDGGGGTNTANFSGMRANYTISQQDGKTVVTRNASADGSAPPAGVTSTLFKFQTLRFADEEVAVCYCSGSHIRVVRDGASVEIVVEALRVGDLAVTASGTIRPITWIGHRDLDVQGRALPHDQQPVRIRAGAFGHDLPARDLSLSPGHPVLVGADADGQGGHLVPIMCLINGTSIARMPVSRVTYWHVELDAHDILLAEGLPAESYLDGGDRPFFDEGSDHALHNPDFIPPGWSTRCRPVAVEGAVVAAERARLDAVFAQALTAHSAWNDANRLVWLTA